MRLRGNIFRVSDIVSVQRTNMFLLKTPQIRITYLCYKFNLFTDIIKPDYDILSFGFNNQKDRDVMFDAIESLRSIHKKNKVFDFDE